MLNLRLRHIAKMIEPCETLIDIGSDHGFLPLSLLKMNIIVIKIFRKSALRLFLFA